MDRDCEEKEWQREMIKWKQRKDKLLEKGGNCKLIKEGRNTTKKVYVKKEVRKGKRRKVMEIAKKKGSRYQRDSNENPEENKGRWESRV